MLLNYSLTLRGTLLCESYLLCFGRLDHIVSLSFGLSKYLI